MPFVGLYKINYLYNNDLEYSYRLINNKYSKYL
jgi:hypothetical protein